MTSNVEMSSNFRQALSGGRRLMAAPRKGMRRAMALTAITAAFAAAQIGSAVATPATAPTIDQLSSGLLKASDLSYWWTRHRDSSGSGHICNRSNPYTPETFAGARFTRGSRILYDDLNGYTSNTRAIKSFNTTKRHASCGTYTDPDGYVITLHPVQTPGLGDGSLALREKVITPDGHHYYWFCVLIRDGKVVLSSAYSPPGNGIPPRADAMKLIRKAYAKEHTALNS